MPDQPDFTIQAQGVVTPPPSSPEDSKSNDETEPDRDSVENKEA